MTVTNYYKVAGHTFGVSGEAGVFALMDNYVPFVNHGDRSMIAAKLHITRPVFYLCTQESELVQV